MASRPRFVTIGRILKSHGVRGELKVEPLTADPDRFLSLKHAIAVGPAGERVELQVARARRTHEGVLVKFTAYDAPETASALRGWLLEVPRSEAIEPPPGQTLFADMIGLTAIEAGSGQVIGPVRGILTAAGNDLLEIPVPAGEILVPWVPELVGTIDLEARTVEIKAIPGLLEPS